MFLLGLGGVSAASGRIVLQGGKLISDLGEVLPGNTVALREAAFLTVISDDPWDLEVTAQSISQTLGSAGEWADETDVRVILEPTHSGTETSIETSNEETSGLEAHREASHREALHREISHREALQRGVSEAGTPGRRVRRFEGRKRAVLRDQPPTGPQGETVALNIEVTPSWDDPPGVPIQMEMAASVSTGRRLLASRVSPSQPRAGTRAAITVWFYQESVGGDQPGEFFVSVVPVPHVEGAPPLPEAKATFTQGGGWRKIVWTPPPAGLAPGRYSYRVVDAADRLVAKGGFTVIAALVGEQGQTPRAAPTGQGAIQSHEQENGPGVQSAFAHSPERQPDVIVTLDGDAQAPGEVSRWRIKIMNVDSIALIEGRVDVCLPSGWAWLGADVPSQPLDGRCRRYLIGTVGAHSTKDFDLTLLRLPFQETVGSSVSLLGSGESRWPPWSESDLLITLFGKSVVLGLHTKITEKRLPMKARPDPGLPVTLVSGVAYVDINRSGAWESGEPTVAGATVVGDGMSVAQTRRSGKYTLSLPGGAPPQLLWTRTNEGNGLPVRLPTGGRLLEVNLPVATASGGSGHASQSNGEHTGGGEAQGGGLEIFAAGGVQSDAENTRLAQRLQTRLAGQWGYLDGLGELSWETGSLDGGIRPDARYRVEGRLSDEEGAEVEALLQKGDQGQVRTGSSGSLRTGSIRTGKPSTSSWRTTFRAPPRRVPSPLGPEATVGATLELAGARGDTWSCGLAREEGALTWGGAGISAEAVHVVHARTEVDGAEEDVAYEVGGTVHGAAELGGFRWPYRLQISAGDPREISPSCGRSPKAGRRWELQFTAPTNAAPRSGRGDKGPASPPLPLRSFRIAGVDWDRGDGRREISATLAEKARLKGTPVALEVEPFLQWPEDTKEAVGDTETSGFLGVRTDARYGAHRLTLDIGPTRPGSASLADVQKDLLGRRALTWRFRGEAVRPWVRIEQAEYLEDAGSSPGINRKSLGEVGVDFSGLLPIPIPIRRILGEREAGPNAGALRVKSRAKRTVTATKVKDRISLRLARGPGAFAFGIEGARDRPETSDALGGESGVSDALVELTTWHADPYTDTELNVALSFNSGFYKLRAEAAQALEGDAPSASIRLHASGTGSLGSWYGSWERDWAGEAGLLRDRRSLRYGAAFPMGRWRLSLDGGMQSTEDVAGVPPADSPPFGLYWTRIGVRKGITDAVAIAGAVGASQTFRDPLDRAGISDYDVSPAADFLTSEPRRRYAEAGIEWTPLRDRAWTFWTGLRQATSMPGGPQLRLAWLMPEW